MFKRKPKANEITVTYHAEASAEPEDPTQKYRDFLDDLAVVFPGILTPYEERRRAFSYGLRFDYSPLARFAVANVKSAADGIRSAETEKAEAAEKKRAAELLKELRSTAAPERRSAGSES